ncbi:BlaI/MecI/CopY family transcriptional regulator [Bacillus horti]|uniref:BlaI family penicillinase repressor n=1 Tax=Caldalkalibacillus horti TaxID=77523 RepID=A0ABT9W1L1_9BACI|nr:BlaI/MecI/CopY family transcriptional regulator [Bacillus horti]MDQ0166952.1 BlaI family penicillinase repressor [Bacillus horti]
MKNLGKLSETEMEVMEVIWKEGTPVTVSKLLDIFEDKDWKTSTMSTLLKRLIEKGFLTKTLDGKVNYYHTSVTMEQYRKIETQTFLNRLYNGKVKNFITALVNDDEFSKKDIAELREWFKQKKGEE